MLVQAWSPQRSFPKLTHTSSSLPPSLSHPQPYTYNSKLDVFTVAERDLFMGDLAANPQFRMSIPPPSTDTLVLVAGPEYFTTKAVDYLTKSGYVEDVIVTL